MASYEPFEHMYQAVVFLNYRGGMDPPTASPVGNDRELRRAHGRQPPDPTFRKEPRANRPPYGLWLGYGDRPLGNGSLTTGPSRLWR